MLVLLHDAVVLRGKLNRVLNHVLRETILCSVQLELNLRVCLAIHEQLASRVLAEENKMQWTLSNVERRQLTDSTINCCQGLRV